MHVDTGIQPECSLLYLQKQFLAAHIGALRSQHTGDPAVFTVVPFLDQIQISEKFSVALSRVKGVQLTHSRLIFLWQLTDKLGNSGSCSNLDMVLDDLRHRSIKIAEGRSARLECLYNIHQGTFAYCINILPQFLFKRPKPMLHPVVQILRHTANQAISRMDMRIDEAGHHHFSGCVNHPMRRPILKNLFRSTDSADPVSGYSHSAIF